MTLKPLSEEQVAMGRPGCSKFRLCACPVSINLYVCVYIYMVGQLYLNSIYLNSQMRHKSN